MALQAGTEGENTLKSCATDAAKGYFAIGQDDNVETKLKDAFEAIAGSIAIAASNGSVADTMGDEVQLSFSGAAPVITTDKAVYDAGKADVYISQGSATYDTTNRRINWTVGSVREGDNPIMKYKVTVKEGYSPSTNEVLDANKEATFSYKNYLGKDTVGTFPVPQVTVGGGNILVITIWSMTRASPSTKTAPWWSLPPWPSRSRSLLTMRRTAKPASSTTNPTRFPMRRWTTTTISVATFSTMEP